MIRPMVEEEKEELGDAIKEFNRGLNSHIEGKLDAALKHFKAALPTFQEFGVRDMLAGTFHELGMVLQEQGELDAALNNFQQSLQLSEEIKYQPGVAKTLFQIGTLHEEQGDIITANEYYKKAHKIKTKRPSGLRFIMFNFGFMGLWALVMGVLGVTGAAAGFDPQFIPWLWEYMIQNATDLGPIFIAFGIIALPAALGLARFKGWGWVMAIFASLLLVLLMIGIIFFWYLSKENIQEMFDVK